MLYPARPVTVNLTRIYTRLGDGGETHLGDMSRVPKTHPRIEAYGTVDELNAQIGVALTVDGLPERFAPWLTRVQNDLFDVGADISVPHGGDRERLRVVPEQTAWLEQACDEVNAELPNLKSFVLPGGTAAAAQLHVCRTVCRRAERADDRVRRGSQRGVRALPQPPLRPPLHPRARGQLGHRRAAMGTGPLPVSDQGLFPAEHRALRELHAMTRQLGGHWSKLGERVGGEAGEVLERGAAATRELLGELETQCAAHGLYGFPAAQGVGGSAAGLRGVSDLLLERNQALRSAVLDMTHVTLLLGYLAELAQRREGTELAAFHRRWEARLREIEESARALAVAEGRVPERAIEPAEPGSLGRAGHAVANGLGTLGEAFDGSAVGRAARRLRDR